MVDGPPATNRAQPTARGAGTNRPREKLAYFAGVMTEDGDLDSYARVEQELKLTALERDEANKLVKNVCAVLKGVVQQAACGSPGRQGWG